MSYVFRLAHHPLCEPYKDQRFQIGKVHLCQGCTLVTIGLITSFILSILLSGYSVIGLITIFVLTTVPIIAIDYFSLSRPFKRLARFLIGFGSGSALGTIFFVPWWKAAIIVGIVLAVFKAYTLLRTVKPAEDLCQSCSLLEEAPYCPGFIKQMEANKKYQDLALPILESQLEERFGIKQQTQEEPQEKDYDVVWV